MTLTELQALPNKIVRGSVTVWFRKLIIFDDSFVVFWGEIMDSSPGIFHTTDNIFKIFVIDFLINFYNTCTAKLQEIHS